MRSHCDKASEPGAQGPDEGGRLSGTARRRNGSHPQPACDEFATIAREVWGGGWDEFLWGYRRLAPLIVADVNFDRPLNETYAVADFDRDAFFDDKKVDDALKIVLRAKVNHYEVMQMQLSLAREIDAIVEAERAK